MINILIAQEIPGTFKVIEPRGVPNDNGDIDRSGTILLTQWSEHFAADMLDVGRVDDGKGFIVNLGLHCLRILYFRKALLEELGESHLADIGDALGPKYDLIRPNEAKPIGCAPSMIWRILER